MTQTKEFPTKLTWKKIDERDYQKEGVFDNESRKIIDAWNVPSKDAQVILYECDENISFLDLKHGYDEVKHNSEYNTVSMFNVAIKAHGIEFLDEKTVFYSFVKSISLQKTFVFELHFKIDKSNLIYFVRLNQEPASFDWNEIKSLDVVGDVVEIVRGL